MSLRNRLKVMKDVFGDSDASDGGEDAKSKRAARRKKQSCLDTIIDGSFMGAVLAVCLAMVLGSVFFAYKNLYYAVMKKFYPPPDNSDIFS